MIHALQYNKRIGIIGENIMWRRRGRHVASASEGAAYRAGIFPAAMAYGNQ